jgi:hypothetical protein
LLIEDFHSVIKEKQQLLTLAYDLSLAILIRKPFGYFGKHRTERAETEQLREEEERLVDTESVHPFYHRFDLTLVVLLCLENFREYFSSVFNSLLLYL